MTLNNITCHSKFPNIFGGETGNQIVACKNHNINHPNNVLWDYKEKREGNPWYTNIIDENEMYNEDFRFKCKFDGIDDHLNKYIQHPMNRFHPIKNYCAGLLINAPTEIKTVFSPNGQTYVCDCGDFQETRVKLMYPEILNSQCADKSLEIKTIEKDKQKISIPYKCFNLFSPITDILKYPPCPAEMFTNNGTIINAVNFEFTTNKNALIEHPQYTKFSSDGVQVPGYTQIYDK